MDIYVEDEEHTVYNLEMQSENTGNIPKRSRYYQSVIDLNLLEKVRIMIHLKQVL